VFDSFKFLLKSFELNLGKFSIPIPYWEAAVLVILIFFLVVSLAQIRKDKVDWSFKGGIIGIFIGFLLALTLEAFLVFSGRTVLTDFLGWKNPPAPLAQALDAGKSRLIKVLGVQTQISSPDALQTIQSLAPEDLKKIKNLICTP
jgi:hypothetical protein